MRTTPAPRRGRIALIRKGTGLVVGTAEIADSLPPLNATALATTRDRHRIPPGLDAEVLAAGWLNPWVLRDVRRLPMIASLRVTPHIGTTWPNMFLDRESLPTRSRPEYRSQQCVWGRPTLF